eukprot:TRINITY_DN8192_c0_g1_i1.p1 TRINITY_DN8192_c0_g1~~TRINITY_DN8192_c0_g1_i1.p1  ORF type:complete len:449 (-),score=102.15 TRINITY_DN8192_c0_g1_i1:121-1290(-)
MQSASNTALEFPQQLQGAGTASVRADATRGVSETAGQAASPQRSVAAVAAPLAEKASLQEVNATAKLSGASGSAKTSTTSTLTCLAQAVTFTGVARCIPQTSLVANLMLLTTIVVHAFRLYYRRTSRKAKPKPTASALLLGRATMVPAATPAAQKSAWKAILGPAGEAAAKRCSGANPQPTPPTPPSVDVVGSLLQELENDCVRVLSGPVKQLSPNADPELHEASQERYFAVAPCLQMASDGSRSWRLRQWQSGFLGWWENQAAFETWSRLGQPAPQGSVGLSRVQAQLHQRPDGKTRLLLLPSAGQVEDAQELWFEFAASERPKEWSQAFSDLKQKLEKASLLLPLSRQAAAAPMGGYRRVSSTRSSSASSSAALPCAAADIASRTRL